MNQLEFFESLPKSEKIINVATVPFRSPFRYAGGKTWLVPRIRTWLQQRGGIDKTLIEPFAGGGIVGLTAAFEKLVDQVVLVEKDEDVAAVWRVILSEDAPWLANEIMNFDLTTENAQKAINNANRGLKERAFATIVKNRVNRGGILANGASFLKYGEGGKGIKSRWYPKTLRNRILDIYEIKEHISFLEGDAFEILEKNKSIKNTVFFIDPPYTVAGRRLYRYSELDHETLFEATIKLEGDFLMTYDNSEYIQKLANTYKLETRLVPMKNTHHNTKLELLIGRNLSWIEN